MSCRARSDNKHVERSRDTGLSRGPREAFGRPHITEPLRRRGGAKRRRPVAAVPPSEAVLRSST